MGNFRNIEIFRCDNDLLKRRSSRAISRRLYLFWFCFAFHSIFCCCWPIRRSKSYNSLPNSREQVSLNIAKYLLAFFGRCCCYRPFNCNHACRTGGVPEQKVLHPSRRDFRKKKWDSEFFEKNSNTSWCYVYGRTGFLLISYSLLDYSKLTLVIICYRPISPRSGAIFLIGIMSLLRRR